MAESLEVEYSYIIRGRKYNRDNRQRIQLRLLQIEEKSNQASNDQVILRARGTKLFPIQSDNFYM